MNGLQAFGTWTRPEVERFRDDLFITARCIRSIWVHMSKDGPVDDKWLQKFLDALRQFFCKRYLLSHFFKFLIIWIVTQSGVV